jgi:hypothetical protein
MTISALRRNIDSDEPITDCSKVVSAVSRDWISELRLSSKNRVQADQVIEHRTTDIGHTALADPRHQVETAKVPTARASTSSRNSPMVWLSWCASGS